MNERIKELAEQARKYARDQVAECKHYGYYTESLDDVYETEFEERFAELIVKECCNVVEDAVSKREPASTYVDKIKKYFEES